MNNSLKEIEDLIKKSSNILITAHVFPDGDSIGSVLGLGLALKGMSKNVFMVMENEIPQLYNFLRGSEQIIFPQEMIRKPDLAIFLDCTDFVRAGENWFEEFVAGIPVINIDHHISNQYFGTVNYVDDQAAATAEIVFRLLKEMGISCTERTATALYTGIVMDTGSFQYQNTTPDTLRTAATLLECGINLSEVREKLFESKSLESLQVISLALAQLKLSQDRRIAWTCLDHESLDKLHVKPEHCDGVVKYPISVSGVAVGILFREMENGMVKVGLRCRTGYDVNSIAGHFGGGGHKLAAGCQLDGPLGKAVQRVLEKTQRVLGDS